MSMIVFNSANNDTLNNLKKLNFFTSVVFHKVWRDYLTYAKDRGRVIGEPKLRLNEKEINVMGIRNNEEISFNDSDNFYNDLLVIEQTIAQSHVFYIFKVTMDPKSKKNKIAHLLEGVYASYTALRPHKWVPGRTAIVQDRDKVLVARTDSTGEIIKEFKAQKGLFGINIHDSAGYINTSLGCTILERDLKENKFHWKEHFKPLIQEISNKEEIDYVVINKSVALEMARSAAYDTKPSRSILDHISFRAPFIFKGF
jgi:hypothetical protein